MLQNVVAEGNRNLFLALNSLGVGSPELARVAHSCSAKSSRSKVPLVMWLSLLKPRLPSHGLSRLLWILPLCVHSMAEGKTEWEHIPILFKVLMFEDAYLRYNVSPYPSLWC